jgi:hypothetical protein
MRRTLVTLTVAALPLLSGPAAMGQTYWRVNGGEPMSGSVLSDFGLYYAVGTYADFDPADTNGFPDVYVYDRLTQSYAWVSSDTAGNPGNNFSGGTRLGPGGPGVAISADGRFVTFLSFATNLVANDNTAGFPDIFLRDRDVSADATFDTPGDVATTRVSLSTGGAEADAMCTTPDISGDGSIVIFASDATNLVANDLNGFRDVFLHNVTAATTIRVSIDTAGTEPNSNCINPSISRDGRYVVFQTAATNLLAVDANGSATDIFIRDTQSNTTALVSQSSSGLQASAGSVVFYGGAVSGDGRYVAFQSSATDLVSPDNNPADDIFVRDTVGGTTVMVSVNTSGVQANGNCLEPSITDDGRYIVFKSTATNLGAAGGPQLRAYYHDRDADADGILDEPGAISTSLGILMTSGPAPQPPAIVTPTGDAIVLLTPVSLEPGDGGFNDDYYFADLEFDADLDGLRDFWEGVGIDADSDGTFDLILPNADHRRKQLYVEVDAMMGRAPTFIGGGGPTGTTLDAVVQTFGNSPVPNPDGSTGIDIELLVDETNLSLASWGTSPWFSFDQIKNGGAFPGDLGRFGTSAERGSPNWTNIRAARMLSYRYCIFADSYCICVPNTIAPCAYQACSSSGRAELPGNDFFVTLGGCDWSGCWSPLGGTNLQQQGVFLHELGHALNLRHGGGDNSNYKPNYYSTMNYSWTLPNGVNASPGSYAGFWPLNYSGAVWPTMNESGGLNETVGINAPVNIRVPVGAPNPLPLLQWTQGAIDFDRDGTPGNVAATADVNYVTGNVPSAGEMLTGYDDWANLSLALSGDPNFADGPSGGTDSGDEISHHELARLGQVGDCNGNGVWDSDDVTLGGFDDCNGDGTPDECGFADSFDAYAQAASMHGMSGWKGWDDSAAATAFVTDTVTRSAPRSLDIEGAADLVHEFCGADFGVWSFEAWQYIPSDFSSNSVQPFAGSYFVLLNAYQDGGPYNWSVQMGFDSNSGNLFAFNGNGLNTVQVPYETDRWKKIQIIIDLDDDWTRVYYDDELVTEYPWTGGVLGEGGGALDIAAVDLYANGASSVYYDDLRSISGCGATRFDDPDADGLDTETELRMGTNSCQPDTDGDGLHDGIDNCPLYYNLDQADCNADGVGDVCELVNGLEHDCNGNGVLDGCDPEAQDVTLFANEMLSPAPDPTLACFFDTNLDGDLNAGDVQPFILRMLGQP